MSEIVSEKVQNGIRSVTTKTPFAGLGGRPCVEYRVSFSKISQPVETEPNLSRTPAANTTKIENQEPLKVGDIVRVFHAYNYDQGEYVVERVDGHVYRVSQQRVGGPSVLLIRWARRRRQLDHLDVVEYNERNRLVRLRSWDAYGPRRPHSNDN